MKRQAGSTTGASPKRSVKSSALPSSTMRSAAAQHLGEGAEARIVEAARALHGRRRGRRSPPRARASSDRSPAVAELRPDQDQRPLGARRARRDAASAAAIRERLRLAARTPRSAGQSAGASSTFSSSRSNGRLRCTGPRRPDRAMRTASATSRAQRRGRAWPSTTPWRRAPPSRPGAAPGRRRARSPSAPACPDSSTSGDSAACAVQSAAAALVKPAPPLTESDAALPGEPAPGVRHVHGGRLVAHVDEPEPACRAPRRTAS